MCEHAEKRERERRPRKKERARLKERKRGEKRAAEYQMPLSSYSNSQADIVAALADFSDPGVYRKNKRLSCSSWE